jgi:DNA-binding LytR/AlgR family response regulator
MRVLIVNKEPNDQSALANVLATRKDVEAFDSAENVSEALDMLREEAYDLVLIDSSTPEASDIEVLDLLQQFDLLRPAVTIVSTRRQPTGSAVDKSTPDVVFRPFLSDRIHEALLLGTGKKAPQKKAQPAPHSSKPVANPSKIAIATEGRALLIDPREVIAVEAEGNYVLLVRSAGSHLVRGCISGLAEKLQPYGFIQIHRCVLVNSSWVDGIHPRSSGDYVLRTRSGKEYPVSRTYKQNLRSLAPLWIGSDALFAE